MENRLARSAARNPWATFGVACAAPLIALLLRVPLAGILEDKAPHITFFLATAVAATYGGVGPGLVATVLGALAGAYLVVRPYGSLRMNNTADYIGFVLFLGIGGFISYLVGRLIDAERHENALRLLFQQTLVSVGDGLISTDTEKRIRLMNPVAEQLTGWTEAEAKGRLVDEVFRIVRENTDTPVEVPVDRILKTGLVQGLANHTELIGRSGERIPIDDSGAPIRDIAGRVAGAVLVFRNIADRRRAEIELEAAERRARTVLESVSDGFLLIDPGWRIAEMNAAAEKMMNIPASSLIGKSHWEAFPGTLGTPLEAAYRKAVADNVPVHLENYYEPWGRWFDVSACPSTEGLAIYLRDITEKKRADAALQRLNEDLKQFTFAATHDIREPLRMITAYVQLLQRKLGDRVDPEMAEYVGYAVSGAHRIGRLIDGLLEFTRVGDIGEAALTRVDTEGALSDALDALQMALHDERGEISREALPSVFGEPVRIVQLFQNLIGNALKYRRSGVLPKVHVSARREGTHWIFSIEDNGIGIAPEHQGHIFIPFKRLHGSEIAGTGIGLATCKRIVERHGGRIWLTSKVGQGSTFYFSLPAAEEASFAAQ